MEKKQETKVVKMTATKGGKKKVAQRKQDKPEQVVQKDYRMFGYKKDQKVELDANFFLIGMHQFLNAVFLNERDEKMVLGENMQETNESLQYTITPLGLKALELSELIFAMHSKLVEEGKAIHRDELMKLMEAMPKTENTDVE